MRIIYPITTASKDEARECIDYLMYNVLPQAGSIRIDANAGCPIEVFMSEDLSNGKIYYHARFVRKPYRTRAKYVGVTSTALSNVCAFIYGISTSDKEIKEPKRVIKCTEK